MIENSLLRWVLSLLLGILTTMVTFWFMNFMINSDDNRMNDSSIYKVIDFVSITKKIQEPEIKKELPPEPQKQKKLPKVPNQVQKRQNVNEMKQTSLNLDMPKLSNNMGTGGNGPKILASMQISKIDSVLTPIVQINPIYPAREKRMGVEGYVKVQLEVDETGHVLSVKIVESEPQGAFDRSVTRALKKWKFRPKTLNGKAVPQTGVLTLNFKLGDN